MSDTHGRKPIAAGKSSFDLIDVNKVFAAINLQPDSVFLDLASGRGAYSIEAAKRIGSAGIIYAVDLWEQGIELLKQDSASHGFTNIKPLHCDAGQVPLPGQSIDVCLLATVLHDFIEDNAADRVLAELQRLMKQNGRLVVIEFKKIEGPPGPPLYIRMSPAEVEEKVKQCGFTAESKEALEVGKYNYLVGFRTTG